MIGLDRHLETAASPPGRPRSPSLTFMQECHHRHQHTSGGYHPPTCTISNHFSTPNSLINNVAPETFLDQVNAYRCVLHSSGFTMLLASIITVDIERQGQYNEQ